MQMRQFIRFLLSGLLLGGLFGGGMISAQTTYHVTDVTQSHSSGSLDSVLYKAISSADSGMSVNVIFSAPGLCQISNTLPPINIKNGSIVFDKDTANISPQGIQLANPAVGYPFIYALSISNNGGTSSITFQNLIFRDFGSHVSGAEGVIYIINAQNITIRGCSFIHNFKSIVYARTLNLTVQNNGFQDVTNFSTIWMNEIFNDSLQYSSYILNNNFHNTSGGSLPVYILNQTTGAKTNHSVAIRNNLIDGYDFGMYIINNAIGFASKTLPDSSFQVEISGNTIQNCNSEAFTLAMPYTHFIIKNNTVQAHSLSLKLSSQGNVLANPYGLNLVNTNSIGIPPLNSNNFFSGTLPGNASVTGLGFFGKGVQLVGLSLPGKVMLSKGKAAPSTSPFIIRATQIVSNDSTQVPIQLLGNSNDTIAKPVIRHCYINNGRVFIQGDAPIHSTPCPQYQPRNYIFEYYKSNSRGDLVQVLPSGGPIPIFICRGYPPPPPFTSASFQHTISNGSGINIKEGDTIAVTFTDYSPPHIRGTSRASYHIVQRQCCSLPFVTARDVSSGKVIAPTPNSDNGQLFVICSGTNFALTLDSCKCNGTGQNIQWVLHNSSVPNIPDIKFKGCRFQPSITDTSLYTVSFTVGGDCDTARGSTLLKVHPCANLNCVGCITSFSPIPGSKYLVSAWVKEKNASPNKISYNNPQLFLDFNSPSTVGPFMAKGMIIDGWQRIEEEFVVPANASDMKIRLQSVAGDVYFDDIRVYPFAGSMKSYVYDPVNMRLVAELDERNYATFYEYDEEGKLVRIKKETERGIMTIQENKNSIRKAK
jgi:hypothetical protein